MCENMKTDPISASKLSYNSRPQIHNSPIKNHTLNHTNGTEIPFKISRAMYDETTL